MFVLFSNTLILRIGTSTYINLIGTCKIQLVCLGSGSGVTPELLLRNSDVWDIFMLSPSVAQIDSFHDFLFSSDSLK